MKRMDTSKDTDESSQASWDDNEDEKGVVGTADGEDSSDENESLEQYLTRVRTSIHMSKRLDDPTIHAAEEGSSSPSSPSSTKQKKENEFFLHDSFFADSPYYSAIVDAELQSLTQVSHRLQCISSKTIQFTVASQQMVLATKELSLVFQNDLNDDNDSALGSEITTIFGKLGKALSEIATAQENMCHFIQNAFGSNLEEMTKQESDIVTMLKEEETHSTERAERAYARYLHGKHAGGLLDHSPLEGTTKNTSPHPNRPTTDKDTSPQPSSPRDRSDFCRSSSSISDSSSGRRGSSLDGLAERMSHAFLHTEHPKLHAIKKLANWRYTIEKIRTEQASAMLKRFQLFKYIVDSKHQRSQQLCRNTGEVFNEFQNFYNTCADIFQAMEDSILHNQSIIDKQREDHQLIDKPLWAQRELLIINTISDIKAATEEASDALHKTNALTDPKSIPVDEIIQIEEMETITGIWELPHKMAYVSKFYRPPTPGVILEGWLYQYKPATMFSPSVWNQIWFILQYDGIYYINEQSASSSSPSSTTAPATSSLSATSSQRNHHHLNSNKKSTLTKHKLCDICTARAIEVGYKGIMERFVFELQIPPQNNHHRNNSTNTKSGKNHTNYHRCHDQEESIILQARGPKKLDMWIGGIQFAFEDKLNIRKTSFMGRNNMIPQISDDREMGSSYRPTKETHFNYTLC